MNTKKALSPAASRGFTLIELLVVIAIIGLLSAVVLASLNGARNKGSNSALKANLANMRAQAEIYYDDAARGNGSYGTAVQGAAACPAAGAVTASVFRDTTILGALSSAQNASGVAPTCATCRGGAISGSATSWAVTVPLKQVEGTSVNWCVDSGGTTKGLTAAQVTAGLAGGNPAARCP